LNGHEGLRALGDRAYAKRLVGGLNVLELQILRCVVAGMSGRDIATAKGIGLAEAEDLRISMMRKLQARTTADAVRIGLLADVDWAD
jgi:two-component system, LuxR family, response regulator FixJ